MPRSILAATLAVAILIGALGAPAMGKSSTMVMETGDSRVMTFAAVTRVAVGDPRVADVKVLSKTEVMLVAKSSGGTTLHVWSGKAQQDYEISVYARNPKAIEDAITKAVGVAGIDAHSAGTSIVLSGSLASEAQRGEVLAAASLFGKETIDMMKVVPPPPQIQIQVKMVEASKEALKELGVDWKGAADGVGMANLVKAVTGGSPTDVVLNRVRMWIDEGKAKLLAEPTLVTVAGTSASFLAGGEIPVPVTVDGQTTVQWKPYGVSLNVTPRMGASGDIIVKVHPEVSTLDWSNATAGTGNLPAVRKRFADTELRVLPGMSVVIAGLLQNEETRIVSKLPVLGNLPIIGGLFRSSRYVSKETELVVVVTPSLYGVDTLAK